MRVEQGMWASVFDPLIWGVSVLLGLGLWFALSKWHYRKSRINDWLAIALVHLATYCGTGAIFMILEPMQRVGVVRGLLFPFNHPKMYALVICYYFIALGSVFVGTWSIPLQVFLTRRHRSRGDRFQAI